MSIVCQEWLHFSRGPNSDFLRYQSLLALVCASLRKMAAAVPQLLQTLCMYGGPQTALPLSIRSEPGALVLAGRANCLQNGLSSNCRKDAETSLRNAGGAGESSSGNVSEEPERRQMAEEATEQMRVCVSALDVPQNSGWLWPLRPHTRFSRAAAIVEMAERKV